jgi:hypothetical protein
MLVNLPCPPAIVRVMHVVRSFFIVDHDKNAPLISELVLVGAFLYHSPSQSGICGQEGVTIL